jgi:dienelactone hydrolase
VTAKLLLADPRGRPTAVALVLHGGRSKSHLAVRGTNLAVLRMRPFASSLRRAGRPHGLVVAQLRYAVRGWNGAEQSPVADATWALDDLDRRYPGLPVALVGHSMGGRTAVYVAGHANVTTVVGLAPWIEAGDPVEPLTGRRVLFAHGTSDRMTSPAASAALAARAAGLAASMSYLSVEGEKHAMLGRPGLWHDLSTGFVLGVLYDKPPGGTADETTTNVLAKALAGQASLVV